MAGRNYTYVKVISVQEYNTMEMVTDDKGRDCSVAVTNPVYMGQHLENFKGRLAINRLTGMPVIVAQLTIQNESVAIECMDQTLVYKALADAGLDSSYLHEIVEKRGLVIQPKPAPSEVHIAGKFGAVESPSTLDTASVGDILLTRDGKLTVDNSLMYLYQEIMNINGEVSNQPVERTTANILFRSALKQASEALNPIKGEAFNVYLRRAIALETFIQYLYNNDPETFTNATEAYLKDVQKEMKEKPENITVSMNVSNPMNLLKDTAHLAICVAEEKEMQKQEFLNTGKGDRIVNVLDMLFIQELLSSLVEDPETSFSSELLNVSVLGTDAIQAGAKMIGRLDKMAECYLRDDNGNKVEPFLPNTSSGIDKVKATVAEFSYWLSKELDTDLGNAPSMFFASKNVDYVEDGDTTYFGKGIKRKATGGGTFEERLGMSARKTKEKAFVKEDGMIDDLISKLGNKKKNKSKFSDEDDSNSSKVTIKIDNDSKLGNKSKFKKEETDMTFGKFGRRDFGKKSFGGNNSFGGSSSFGTKGGNKSFGAKQEEIVELVFDGGDGTVFYADLNEMIDTDYGPVAAVYAENGDLVGGVFVDGKAMNTYQEYVGDMIDAPKKFSFGSGKSKFGVTSFQASNRPFGSNGVRKNPINTAGFGSGGRTRFL